MIKCELRLYLEGNKEGKNVDTYKLILQLRGANVKRSALRENMLVKSTATTHHHTSESIHYKWYSYGYQC